VVPDILHIGPDGALESHAEAEQRLLQRLDLPADHDLFRSRSELLSEAYRRREESIAYRRPTAQAV
jgi:hypothetical protein